MENKMSSLEVFDLTGKRILITGASSGFGAHFAQVLSSKIIFQCAHTLLESPSEVARMRAQMGGPQSGVWKG